MNDSYIKLQQDNEFEYAQLLDSIHEIHKLIQADNKQKEKLIDLFESQSDLVNNIKGQNKYNNPRLNEKYKIENDKLLEIKEQLDKFLENSNKLQEKLQELQNKIECFT